MRLRCCLSILLFTVLFLLSSSLASETTTQSQPEDTLEDVLVKETIEAGRGYRDEPGVRDQWSSEDHLKERYDTRRPISPRVQKLLQSYRLDCEGCDNAQAVAKVNAFIKEAKEFGEQQEKRAAKRTKWLEQLAVLVTVVAVIGGGMVLYTRGGDVNGLLDGLLKAFGNSSGSSEEARKLIIEKQRQKLLEAAEQRASAENERDEPPTWRENEELEVWTAKQEKQFQKALNSFGGVPPKARYILISDKVDGKSRQECLMHHKLQMAIAKEQEHQEEN